MLSIKFRLAIAKYSVVSFLLWLFHQLIIFRDDHKGDHNIPFVVDPLSSPTGLTVFALSTPIDVNHRDGYLNSPGLTSDLDLWLFPKSPWPAASCSSFCPSYLKNSPTATLPSTDRGSWTSQGFNTKSDPRKGSGEPRLLSQFL